MMVNTGFPAQLTREQSKADDAINSADHSADGYAHVLHHALRRNWRVAPAAPVSAATSRSPVRFVQPPRRHS
jgi:hypothetical protein